MDAKFREMLKKLYNFNSGAGESKIESLSSSFELAEADGNSQFFASYFELLFRRAILKEFALMG